jgi:hypothetical protein
MRLEKKQDAEIAERKGMTTQTIVQIVWFIISGGISYWLITFMLASEEIPLSYAMFYSAFGISRSAVPEGVILAVLVLLLVMFFQIFLWLGFAMVSPEGRRRTGDASMYSRNQDPFDRG